MAKRHRQEGPLALSDLTVLSCEGHTCPFAQLGHARDGPKGKGQRVFGRVCHAAGCPVAVEVFAGNTGDPPTVAPVSAKLRQRFHLRRVGLVGDRGLLTDARLREELKPVEGLDWMTALRHPTVRTLVDSGALARGGCAHTDLIALTAAASPDERLMACDKASLADERRRKREALLQATACERETIGQATTRAKRRLTGQAPMALRVGKVLNRFKMGARFLRRDTQVSIAYSEELIFPISATLQSTDRHHGIVGQERCHFQRDS